MASSQAMLLVFFFSLTDGGAVAAKWCTCYFLCRRFHDRSTSISDQTVNRGSVSEMGYEEVKVPEGLGPVVQN